MQRSREMKNGSRRRCAALRRRGSTLSVVLIVLSIAGAFGIAAYIVVPRSASGSSGGGAVAEVREARLPYNQLVMDGVTSLIGASSSVLAVHQRDRGPYVEILLRTHDASGTGELAADEIVLLSHSEILQTIKLYTIAEGEARGSYGLAGLWGWPEPSSREFADRWRSHSRVEQRVIATGVSSMNIERMPGSRLRISLIWASESADARDEASAVVAVR